MTKASYKDFKYTLAPGATETVVRAGQFLSCLEAAKPFQVSFDNGSSFDMHEGLTVTPRDGFESVQLRNPNASDLVVKVAVGTGDVKDSRLVLSGELMARVTEPSALASTGPTPIAQGQVFRIAASDAARRSITVQLQEGEIWVHEGGKAVSGLKVEAGGHVTLTTTSEVWGYASIGPAEYSTLAERLP